VLLSEIAISVEIVADAGLVRYGLPPRPQGNGHFVGEGLHVHIREDCDVANLYAQHGLLNDEVIHKRQNPAEQEVASHTSSKYGSILREFRPKLRKDTEGAAYHAEDNADVRPKMILLISYAGDRIVQVLG